jgi:hypothetical protein
VKQGRPHPSKQGQDHPTNYIPEPKTPSLITANKLPDGSFMLRRCQSEHVDLCEYSFYYCVRKWKLYQSEIVMECFLVKLKVPYAPKEHIFFLEHVCAVSCEKNCCKQWAVKKLKTIWWKPLKATKRYSTYISTVPFKKCFQFCTVKKSVFRKICCLDLALWFGF